MIDVTSKGSEQHARQNGVVYIVDDDSGLRASLSWLLESVGIESICFGSVREFLDAQLPSRPAPVLDRKSVV